MSQDETKNLDNLSDAELSTALKREVDVLDGKVEADPASVKEEAPEKVEEPKGDDATKEGDEPETEEGNPYRKRIDRLVRKSRNLGEELSVKDKLLAEKDAEIARLRASEEPAEEEAPSVASEIEKVLEKRDAKSKSEAERFKAQEDEFSNLIKKVPEASKRKAEILELAETHPNLTFEAIDRILAPEDHVDPIEKNRRNAKRMDVSARSRADLESEVDPKKLSTSQLEKELRGLEKSGKLSI